MKNKIYQGLIALTLFAALMLPTAQAEPKIALKASIPFEFVVNEKHLPSGEYEVSHVPNTAIILIQSRDGRSAAYTPPAILVDARSRDVGELVFNRYGDQYFLSRIVTPGDYIGSQLTKSRLERELARSMAEPGTAVVVAQSVRK